MTIDNPEDLEGMRHAGRAVASILQEMLEAAEVGMTTAALDAIGAEAMARWGARSAPQVTYGFPGATCLSVNEEVAHGIPGERVLAAGDILNIDVSAEVEGYFGDNAATIVLGEDPRKQALCDAARRARDLAISRIRPGAPYNLVGRVIQTHAEKRGFKVIRNLCSHGIGRALHEEPSEVLGFYDRFDKRRFSHGLVLTIEPFLSTDRIWIDEAEDGWTLLNSPEGLSAQFEHTILVREGRAPEILTTLG